MGYDYMGIDDHGQAVRRIGPDPKPDTDSLYHYYKPIDPDDAHRWATREALSSIFVCILIGIPASFVAVVLTLNMGITPTDNFLNVTGKMGIAIITGFVFPIAWPFRALWVSPWRAYRDTISECRAWRHDYDDVAIERLRQPRQDKPGTAYIASVEKPATDPLEELYRQCALVLVRARHDPTVPRTASERLIYDIGGMTVTVDKSNYARIATVLCQLGFMTGGDGKAYKLTYEWQNADEAMLLMGLKARKHLIRLEPTAPALALAGQRRGDSESWQ